MTVHAVLRVRGPALRVLADGHPPLIHEGHGESVWTVAMDPQSFDRLIAGLRQAGNDHDVTRPAKSSHPTGKFDACQFCAFFDPVSATQCGFTDWDCDTRCLVAATPDGQSSLGRCPEGHTAQ